MKELFRKLCNLFNFGKENRMVNFAVPTGGGDTLPPVEKTKVGKATPAKVPLDADQPVEAAAAAIAAATVKGKAELTHYENEMATRVTPRSPKEIAEQEALTKKISKHLDAKPGSTLHEVFAENEIAEIYENIKELPKDLNRMIRDQMKNAKIDQMSPEDLQRFAEKVDSIVDNYMDNADVDEDQTYANREARKAIRKLAPSPKEMTKKVAGRGILKEMPESVAKVPAVADIFGEEEKPYFAGWGPEGGEEEAEKPRVAGGGRKAGEDMTNR